jgi:hypothetical protein
MLRTRLESRHQFQSDSLPVDKIDGRKTTKLVLCGTAILPIYHKNTSKTFLIPSHSLDAANTQSRLSFNSFIHHHHMRRTAALRRLAFSDKVRMY